MPRVIDLQTNFNSGVLDPRLAARTDIKHFYQGADTAANVVSMPQGGLKRRGGMMYVDTVASEARLASFAFNVEQTYLMVFTNNNIAVYKDDVKQADIATTYTTAELFELQWTQSADTMIIVHENHAPAKLVRGASHTSWTLSDISFRNYPTFDFDADYSANTFTVGTGGEDATVVANSVTVTASASTFASGDVGGIFESLSVTNSGKGRITGYISATVVTIEVTVAWDNATGNSVAAGDAVLEEPVWSASRGWPKSATFYQGRMWFGGSKSRPQTLWGSKTNDFYNFDVGTGLDDEGIDVTLDTDQVNAITAVFAGRHLQVFTTGGEFSMQDSPITPAKSAVQRQTLFGSAPIPPKSIDGATFFLDRTGKAVREFIYTYAEEAYTSNTVSLLASHTINAPVDMDVQRGTPDDDASYLFLVNNDGTVSVFNTLRAQEVGGWTTWTTNGTVESIATVVDEVYLVVKRNINGSDQRFIEEINKNHYTDCSVLQTLSPASDTVTGLGHLNGEECRVKADGAVQPNETPSGGSITLGRDATTVEVGLNFDTTIKTMPLNMQFQDGPTLTRKKRITQVEANLYESLGVYINGNQLADRQFGEDMLDTTPTPFTGIKETHLLGWDEAAQVTITQQDPVPMTVLALAIEVEA